MTVVDDTSVHPGTVDPQYLARRAEIAALATGRHHDPADIAYTPVEDGVWAAVQQALSNHWDAFAATPVLGARSALGLPTDRVPQLGEVTELLEPLGGFRYRAVPGLVDKRTFFGALADGVFLSTQYVRHQDQPLYTPEPDVIHEVIGHAHLLAVPQLAELHRLAGAAITRAERDDTTQFIADVFWFSAEYGVLTTPEGPKAYGAGLLSSYGELGWFSTNARVEPLDVVRMGHQRYDITHYQPVLFGGSSLDEVLDVVGGFFADADDDHVDGLRR